LRDDFYVNCAQSYPQAKALPKKKLKGKPFFYFNKKYFILLIFKNFFRWVRQKKPIRHYLKQSTARLQKLNHKVIHRT